MADMLRDAAGGLHSVTNGKLDFHVISVGVAPLIGKPTEIRYNCYIQVSAKPINHLFFQVTTPSGGPFPALLGTPEGEKYADIKDEAELREVIKNVMARPRTQEVVDYLARLA